MSWQDDLGELDRALADGRISADAYRRRRDDILAEYSAAQATPDTPAEQPERPGDEPTTRRVGPFAPPFSWSDTNPDTTQVVPDSADTTQVVPRNSADATQVVNAESTHRPGWHPGPSAWPGEPDTISPPNPTWLVQGPEVFRTGRTGRGRIAAIVVAVVVVIGLIVGGFLLFGHGGRVITHPSTNRPRPPDELAIAALPGSPEDHGDVTMFGDAATGNFLTPQEIGWYREAGAGRARLATSTTSAGVHILVFTTVTSSPGAATVARDNLARQQLIYGMTESDTPPPDVRVAEVDRTATVPATIRAHYTHGTTVVRIQVNGNDLTAVQAVFQDVIRAQTKVLAPRG